MAKYPEYLDKRGSGVQVQDSGNVLLDPTIALNFKGAGVAVSDKGGGLVEVNVPGGGGGGVDLENASVPLAGGPFTTLNMIAMLAADSGGGVATLTPAQGLADVLSHDNDGNAQTIENILDPTNDQDAATKKYVDDQIAGVPVGLALANDGTPLAGGPFLAIDGIGGGFADEGAGIASYTPPAGGGGAWTTVSKGADQDVSTVGHDLDTELFTGTLTAGVTYRIRARIMVNNVGGGSFGYNVQFAGPALAFCQQQLYSQPAGSNGNLRTDLGTTLFDFNSGNTGLGALEYFIVLKPSADGIVQLTFGESGGVGTCTVLAGSYLEYGPA